MATLKQENHEWCLLRTQIQPDAGWGDMCKRCKHATSRVNSDFPCKKHGTKRKPYPTLTRYSFPMKEVVDDLINRRDIKKTDVMGVDFVELCLAFVWRGDRQA